jgi:NAD(P)-dependent dehydrogenase (short-subunit alcohol dehydrogenase family)
VTAGSKGTPTSSVYSASKAAVRCFVRVWTNELKDRRIRFNAISPGPIDTRIQQDNVTPDTLARLVAAIPMGRLGLPEEVARAVLFLASDDSTYVTGIELFVDGGRAQV